jgi:hypothetical protein
MTARVLVGVTGDQATNISLANGNADRDVTVAHGYNITMSGHAVTAALHDEIMNASGNAVTAKTGDNITSFSGNTPIACSRCRQPLGDQDPVYFVNNRWRRGPSCPRCLTPAERASQNHQFASKPCRTCQRVMYSHALNMGPYGGGITIARQFCSLRCNKAWHRGPLGERVCSICSRAIPLARRTDTRFCSAKCKQKAWRMSRPGASRYYFSQRSPGPTEREFGPVREAPWR